MLITQKTQTLMERMHESLQFVLSMLDEGMRDVDADALQTLESRCFDLHQQLQAARLAEQNIAHEINALPDGHRE